MKIEGYLDMETWIRKLDSSDVEAVVFLGKVGVSLSGEHLRQGRYTPYDGIFLVLDEEDNYNGEVQQLPQADCILLPLPLEQSGLPLAQLLGEAKPGALALGGKVTESARTVARAAGVELVDYFARPELTVYNAIPTAEGCIGILLERRSRTLWGAAVLVLGFGPVGRALAVRLAALGARVTVAARRPVQRAMAEEQGLRAVPLTDLAAAAAAFDTVVNTIPAPVLTAAVLAALPKGCLIVDLASKPGGTDFAAARRLGHTALHALSLPTVWAPETAGEALARTVQAILQEREGTI